MPKLIHLDKLVLNKETLRRVEGGGGRPQEPVSVNCTGEPPTSNRPFEHCMDGMINL